MYDARSNEWHMQPLVPVHVPSVAAIGPQRMRVSWRNPGEAVAPIRRWQPILGSRPWEARS